MIISKSLKFFEDKARIDKAENQSVAHKIQVYTNNKVDEYIESYKKGVPHKPVQSQLMAELGILNKPSVYKNYMRIINSPYYDASLIDKMLIKNEASANLDEVVEEELIRIAKNLDVIEYMMQEYDFVLEDYQRMVKEQEAISMVNSNRYQILKQAIEEFDGNDTFKIPEGYNYHEIKWTAENLLRQSQMKSKFSEVDLINKKNEENGVDWRYVEKYWIHTHRGKTTRHASNHMQHVPIDQPFIVVNDYTLDIDEMMHPCDPRGSYSNAYICYCEMEFRSDDGKILGDTLNLTDENVEEVLDAEENKEKIDVEENKPKYDMEYLDKNGRVVENKKDAVILRSKDGKYQIVGENPYNTNENVEKASLDFARKSKDNPYESLGLITEKGNVPVFNIGEKSLAHYSKQDLINTSKYDNGQYGNVILTHNHPVVAHERSEFSFDGIANGLPTYFSKGDLRNIPYKAFDNGQEIIPTKQIQVYANSGFRMTITRNGGSPTDNSILNNPNNKIDSFVYKDKLDNDDTDELKILNKEMKNVSRAYNSLLNRLDDDAYEKYRENYKNGMYGKNKKMSKEERAEHLREVSLDICKNDGDFNKAIYEANKNLKEYGFSLAGEWFDV